ncbi:DMT family transporter [Cohnella herbarum]|uniref:DMT family transporter n=1 Tax=Cohnella herbarum TaxID=2728023 RepID=A0A7Z2ZKR7_9BACL|nr:DMT family transporter [Cohnella herbarum]QJD83059.1 DMT family transporter [Cohnella herbarum]
MIQGILLAVVAGSLVGLQNIYNSKVNERAGSWTTTSLVLGLGFLASMTIGLFVEGIDLFDLRNMKVWYGFSGLIGVGVVICLVRGIRLLGPTYGISLVMISQLGFALVCDSFGLLGLDQVPFTYNKLLGVLVIVAGIIVFKFKSKPSRREMEVECQVV